jgi:hypothetical protein
MDGVHPRAMWQGNPNIAKWGLTWREMDDGYIEIRYSIFMKGVMLPGHDNVLEVLAMENDVDVDVLICLHPLGGAEGDGQPDYIAVRLPWDRCSEVICGDKANGVGMVFDDSKFPKSEEEMMECWAQMTSARLTQNAEIGAKKGKAIKKKASAPSSTGGGEAESCAPRKLKAKPKEADDVILDIERPSGTETSCRRRQGHRISTRFIVPSRSGWQIASYTRRTGFMAHSIPTVFTLPPTQ